MATHLHTSHTERLLCRNTTVLLASAALLAIGYLQPFVPLVRPTQAISSGIVISQVYGGGGNSGATYRNDFIELFNRGSSPASVNGWSVQYASATGTTWQVTNLTNVTIQPGQYYLVQEAQGAGGTTNLPTPDATGTIAMAATAGKVALVNTTTALSGSGCPIGANVIDFVGFGTTANCSETAVTPAPSNTTTVLRAANGCTETDNNSTDFAAGGPNPRNTATALNPCSGVDAAPNVSSTVPTDNATGVAVNANLTITFSEAVNVGSTWFQIVCGTSGTRNVTDTSVNTADNITFTINPTTDFAAGEICTVTVVAAQVTDQDATDPPDNMAADYVFDFTTIGSSPTLIHDIQGSVEAPNFNGNVLFIRGIVVGDYQGSSNLSGFFVQEEDSEADANPVTSEGIFVFDGGSPTVVVNVGDDVTVTGTVTNFPNNTAGLTELSSITSVIVNSTGNPLPAAVTPSLPVPTSAVADLERFEGMRVSFSQTLYVTDVGDLGTFGEVEVSVPTPFLSIPTNSIDPNDNPASGTSTSGNSNVAAITTQQSLNNRSHIIIDDGTNKTASAGTLNPIPYLLPSGTLRRGDFVANPSGVMTFNSAVGYEIEPAPTITFAEGNPRPAVPPLIAGSNLRLASYNCENYFLTTGTGRGADNAAELTRQRDKIVSVLEGLNADVIGLIELEKAGGNAAAADLAAALTARGTVGAYVAVADLGTLNGTDPDIKNGMIYRTSTVTPVGTSFSDTSAPAGSYSRDPLTQMFRLNATGRGFALVVHHARSKSCSGAPSPPDPDADLGDGQSCFNDRRRNQSQLVAAFVNNLSSTTVSDVLVVGDFNSYGEEDPIDVFRGGSFTDEIGQFMSAASKYSFTFNGETGQLDHAFATSTLALRATGATIWHANADEPAILDYNTNNNPANPYQPNAFRASDHDPLLVSFNLVIPSAANGMVSGRVTTPDRAPLAGAVINLSGSQTRRTITDSNGSYSFDNVETAGFYTVAPARTNYSFTPAARSLSVVGSRTEAAFTANWNGDNANPLDTAEYFVRQQYLDLLGREPDEGGFNYWSAEINRCADDANCTRLRRLDVATAFFVEQEFQWTGSFIYNVYKGALGRRPVFTEYSLDWQQIVHGGNLEARETAFIDQFVARPEFVARYQASNTAETFVDALIATVQQSVGTDLSGQREALIIRYQSGGSASESRVLVLRELAENQVFRQAEYNSAFVLTEYFAYLRRNPDPSGYDFWVNVLNNGEPGNYRGMVCAFITSPEYQRRFSSVVSHNNGECAR